MNTCQTSSKGRYIYIYINICMRAHPVGSSQLLIYSTNLVEESPPLCTVLGYKKWSDIGALWQLTNAAKKKYRTAEAGSSGDS